MKRTLWATTYFLAFILAVIGAGYLGLRNSIASILAPPPDHVGAIVPLPSPLHSATKATVAVLLGNTATESTDFLRPYEMFAESGAYNVYAVASSRDVRALSRGLGVVPDLSFRELEARLPAGPDVVIVPAIVNIKAPENWTVLNSAQRAGEATSGAVFVV
jgi:AraC family transcriptional activator FtrA